MSIPDIRGTRRKTFKIGGVVFDASAVTGTKTVTLPNADVTLGSGGGGATLGDITAAIDAHELEANPHPTYMTQAEGDALYAPIGGGGVPFAQAMTIASLRI